MSINSRMLAVAVGLSLVLIAWVGLFSANDQTLYHPLPMLTVVSVWTMSYAGVLVPAILFFLWIPSLFLRQQSTLPRRTIGLVAILTALMLAEFETVWKAAIQYQGLHLTVAFLAINTLWLGAIWWTVVHAQRRPSFGANLLSHWILFAWLGWYAFPFLGEPINF